MHYKKDYLFGTTQELEIFNIIKDYFKTDLIRCATNCKYDYADNVSSYEVKSRTNTLKYYPDTMITCNKISNDKPLYFIFNFVDCITYIKYDEEKFKKYKTKMFSRARISTDEKLHVYIPIEDLTTIYKKV